MAAGAAGMLGAPDLGGLLRTAMAAPACATLADIEHVVIFIQENRSFDHYFGRYPGVVGFDDRSVRLGPGDDGTAVFRQQNPGQSPNPVLPFHINTDGTSPSGECTHDIGHQWLEQHQCWDGGKMDAFVKTHVAAEGPAAGPLTMGFYDRRDLPFYWALADHFTICDRYHTSAISGTVANRIYGLTGMIDPDGRYGGPVVNTPESGNQQDYDKLYGALSWRTYPEVLQDNGVSWKVYNPDQPDFAAPLLNDNYLVFFKQYLTDPALAQAAFASQGYPANLIADIQAGTLPEVSWVLTTFVETEHPPAPIRWGEFAVGQAVQALLGNPALFAKTALLITWDDSGGFFDHVPPPVPPDPTTPGEHLTATPPVGGDGGITGPIGLGFRVPMIIVSPFTRNPTTPGTPGWRPLVASDVFDHTSQLRFIREWLVARGKSRADVELPYDTAWRRSTVGDLTTAFSFGAQPALSPPGLSYPSAADVAAQLTKPECVVAPGTEFPAPQPDSYTPINQDGLPRQDSGRAIRPVLAGAACAATASPAAAPVGVTAPAGGGMPNTSGTPTPPAMLGLALGAASLAAGWWARRRATGGPE